MNSKPLLILDLDETLWYGSVDGIHNNFLLRPFLGYFIETVGSKFDLAVWTAATLDWAEEGLAALRSEIDLDLRSQLVFLWDRSHTTEEFHVSMPYAYGGSSRRIKDGDRLIQPEISTHYPMSRILVVDDHQPNYQKILNNYVPVTEWTGDQDDDELWRLADFLVSISHHQDFRKVAKMNWRG